MVFTLKAFWRGGAGQDLQTSDMALGWSELATVPMAIFFSFVESLRAFWTLSGLAFVYSPRHQIPRDVVSVRIRTHPRGFLRRWLCDSEAVGACRDRL